LIENIACATNSELQKMQKMRNHVAAACRVTPNEKETVWSGQGQAGVASWAEN
jgi:DNA-binding protein H-NS